MLRKWRLPVKLLSTGSSEFCLECDLSVPVVFDDDNNRAVSSLLINGCELTNGSGSGRELTNGGNNDS